MPRLYTEQWLAEREARLQRERSQPTAITLAPPTPSPASVRVMLCLPFPPTANHAYAQVNGQRVLTDEHKHFRALVAQIANRNRANIPLLGRIAISLVVYMPDNRKRDIDNFLKPTMDAMTDAGV